MKKVDYFTGETPLEVVSPPVSQEEQMASFGQAQYGGPPVNIGGVGYSSGPGNFQQGAPYGGIGYNFGYYRPPNYASYGYNPYQQQVQGNPAFSMLGSDGRPVVQAQDVTVTIPAYNPWGSEYLFPVDYEDKLFDLQWLYWWDMQTSSAEQTMAQPQFGYGYPNYYGNQYYSTPYNYSKFTGSKYVEQFNEMKEKAKEERLAMNMRLTELAYNYLGKEFDADAVKEMYTGKTITVPGITTLDLYQDSRLHSLVPFDNSQMYRDYDAKVSAEFRKRIGADADMNTTFENLGLVAYDYEMEEELHRRRRDLKSSYDSNTYKTLVRQKVFDEKVTKDGNMAANQIKDMRDNLLGSGMFPTLSQSARLADDGTMNITYSYNPGEINNLNESQFAQEKARFNSFLDSIPSSLGGG